MMAQDEFESADDFRWVKCLNVNSAKDDANDAIFTISLWAALPSYLQSRSACHYIIIRVYPQLRFIYHILFNFMISFERRCQSILGYHHLLNRRCSTRAHVDY